MARLKPQKSATKSSVDSRMVVLVRGLLAGIRKVEERRMFGATGFMVRGNLCVTARPTRIMCRIDPTTHDAAIKRKGCRTVIMRGRPYRGYIYVDAAALATETALLYWVGQALQFNRTLSKAAK